MIVVSLKKLKNNVEIFFDDGNSVLIDYRIVQDFGLRKNDFIDENKKDELLLLSDKIRVKDAALKLILRRPHSSQELKNKLLRKGYKNEIIKNVIEELESKNYLNDTDFCKTYFEERFLRKKIGLNKIRAELVKKGIDRKIIDNVLSSVDENISYLNAIELAKKKMNHFKYDKIDKGKIKQKLYLFLTARGFQFDVIKKVFNELKLDNEELP